MNALIEIEIGYGVKLSDDARALLTEASLTSLEFEKDGSLPPWGKSQPILSLDALAKLRPMLGKDDEVRVRRVIGNSTTEALARFGQRNTTIENTRCNVAVAGLGLLTVDEVQHENDCCTHQLQDLLNDGWRILAVCVQPDQRRPDYILGRTNLAGARPVAPPDRPEPMPTPKRELLPLEGAEIETARAVTRPAPPEPAPFGESLPPASTPPTPAPPSATEVGDDDIPF